MVGHHSHGLPLLQLAGASRAGARKVVRILVALSLTSEINLKHHSSQSHPLLFRIR